MSIARFYDAVQRSFVMLEGPVPLKAHQVRSPALLASCLNRRDLDRLYVTAAAEAASHPLRDRVLVALDAVRGLYDQHWQAMCLSGGRGADVLSDEWDAAERRSAELREALAEVRKYRDLPVSELSNGTTVETNGQADTESDTPEKNRKRGFTVEVQDCIRRLSTRLKTDPTVSMKHIVEEYAEERKAKGGKPVSITGLLRRLSDYSELWKPDANRTRTRHQRKRRS